MSDMDNCGLTKDDFVKYVDQIKEQAILAIEKRDKVIAQKDKEIEELRVKLEEEQRTIKNLLVEINNETKKINNIGKEQEMIKRLIEFLTGLVENKNNEKLQELEKKLDETQTSLTNERTSFSKQIEALTMTKEQLEQENEENAKKVEKLNQKINELNEHLTQEQEKCRQSEAEKEQVTNELNKLKEDMHYELYEQYCALSEDFRNRCISIDFSDLYCFVKTSSQDGILKTLYEFIKEDVRLGKPEVGSLMNFFDALFEVQAKKGEFMRFGVGIGDEYTDREMIKIGGGPVQGKVKKVIFRGYKRVVGNESGKSLVEVE